MTDQAKGPGACCSGEKSKSCCSSSLGSSFRCTPCLVLWGIVALVVLGKFVLGF